MPEPSSKPTLGRVYQQQYRQVSSSKTPQAFRIIGPAVFLIVAIFLRRWPIVAILLGVVAVLLLAAAIFWSRKRGHDSPARPD